MKTLFKKDFGFAQFFVLIVFAVLAVAIPVTANLVTQRQNLTGQAGNSGPYPTAVIPTAVPSPNPCICSNHVMVGGCDSIILGKPCNITPTLSPSPTPMPTLIPCVCVNHVMVGGCDNLILGKPCDITPSPAPTSYCGGLSLPCCSGNCFDGSSCVDNYCRAINYPTNTPTPVPTSVSYCGYLGLSCCSGACYDGSSCTSGKCQAPPICNEGSRQCSGSRLQTCVCSEGSCSWHSQNCEVGCNETLKRCIGFTEPTPTIPVSDPACIGKSSGSCCGTSSVCAETSTGKLICKSCSDGRVCRSGQGCVLVPTPTPSIIPVTNYHCNGNNLMQGNQIIDTCSYGCDSATLQCRSTPAACGTYSSGSSRCNTGSTIYEICDNGSWLTRTCPSGRACQDGFCRQPEVVQVCNPGGTICRGNDVYTCKLDGSDYERSRNCAWGCTSGSCMNLGQIVDDVTGGDPQALNFALVASGMEAAPLITTTAQTALQSVSPYLSSAYSAITNTLAQVAYNLGPTLTQTGLTTAKVSTGLLATGIVGQGIAGSYETITGDTTNNTISNIDYYSNLAGQAGSVGASVGTGLYSSGQVLTTIGENYANSFAEGASIKGSGVYKSSGGQKLVINPKKDSALSSFLDKGTNYVLRNRTSGSVSRVDLATRFVNETIQYDSTVKGNGVAGAIKEQIYIQGGGTASLGEFCESGTGVCREQAAALHTLLAAVGKESFVTTGDMYWGRHAWVEYIDSVTGKRMVADATNNVVGLVEQVYREVYGGVTNIQSFQFVKP